LPIFDFRLPIEQTAYQDPLQINNQQSKSAIYILMVKRLQSTDPPATHPVAAFLQA
jgi:hypothetical protein